MTSIAERRPAAAFDVSGLVAVVTGAGSGIGRGTALHLAAAGATVVCADIDEAGAAATAAAAGGGSYPARADVAHRASVEGLVAAVIARHGRIDAMCNIAGIITEAPLLELSEAEFDRMTAVNLKGVLFGGQAAGAAMAAAGRGAIVTAMTERHYTRADGAIDEEARAARLAVLSSVSPLGAVGLPEDIAFAVRYLISDAARFLTGQVIRVNGGAMMP